MRALSQANVGIAIEEESKFAALEPWSNRFSSVRSELSGVRLTNESGFYLPTDTIDDQWTMPRRAVLSIDVATDGISSFVFNGSGTVMANATTYPISAGQQSVPSLVQLGSDLIRFSLPSSPGSEVRAFVGTVPGEAAQMRVCWNIDVPGVLRVSCTRHLRADGSFVTVDTIDDLSGTLYTLVGSRPTLNVAALRCTYSGTAAGPFSYKQWVVTAFDRQLQYGGLLAPNYDPGSNKIVDFVDGSQRYDTSYNTNTGGVQRTGFHSFWASNGAIFFYDDRPFVGSAIVQGRCSLDGSTTLPTADPVAAASSGR
ncbi:MAG: hypothetical protein R3E83_10930 [Burkholderiaceae bacterium]